MQNFQKNQQLPPYLIAFNNETCVVVSVSLIFCQVYAGRQLTLALGITYTSLNRVRKEFEKK